MMDERDPATPRCQHTDAAEHGSPWLKELYDYFAPVRQEILERGVSEAELNADIDAAIAAVRAGRRTTS